MMHEEQGLEGYSFPEGEYCDFLMFNRGRIPAPKDGEGILVHFEAPIQ